MSVGLAGTALVGGAPGWSGGPFNSVALAPNGTNVAPGYSFTAAPSFGMYFTGTNLGFAAGNGLAMALMASPAQLLVPQAASATAPDIGFTGDNNTGIYSIAADRLGVVAGGVPWLEVNNTSGVSLSMLTQANASSMTKGQLRLVFQASGVSLMYSSGASSYMLAGSAQSVAQT